MKRTRSGSAHPVDPLGARLRALRIALLAVAIGLGAGMAAPVAAAAAPSVFGPYFSAPFQLTRLPYRFGQAPSWTVGGDVLSVQSDSAGITQIYVSSADGRGQRCLTCRTVRGPNGLPQERAQGDWILFESYGEQPVHVGTAGLGGYGGDLYVMHPDGTHVYRLTTNSDPDDGAPYTASTGVPYDNFHAYWSPNGRQIIWTHTEAEPLPAGGQRWEIMLGTFTVRHGRPALTGVRVVGRPYGAYETQPWSPDGQGFLFFAAGGYRSPFQVTPPGWGNARVYYMRLYGPGASPAHPRVTLIGDNAPVYEEQAVFTPDMKTVLMMSSRGDTQQSWYDLVAAAAQRTRFDAPDTGSTQTLQFLADFDGQDFHSDLFAVDVATHAIRRLTYLDQVLPEFFWNQTYTRLLLGFNGLGAGAATYTGQFEGITAADRRVPRRTPAALYGQPVDMARVGAQAQSIRDPGPTSDTPIAVTPPTNPARAFPHAARSSDKATIPAVTATYVTVWLSDLEALGRAASAAFTSDPLARLGPG